MNSKTIALACLLLAAPFALPSALATAEPTVAVSMDAETYSAASTLMGDAPVATVTVLDANGTAVAGATVTLTILRQVQFVGFVASETVTGTTGPDGTVTLTAPTASCAPGTYLVVARALGVLGSDRYTVNA